FVDRTACNDVYTLSLHDALPICFGSSNPEAVEGSARRVSDRQERACALQFFRGHRGHPTEQADAMARSKMIGIDLGTTNSVVAVDRKSTRLNSSHVKISYAAFCL